MTCSEVGSLNVRMACSGGGVWCCRVWYVAVAGRSAANVAGRDDVRPVVVVMSWRGVSAICHVLLSGCTGAAVARYGRMAIVCVCGVLPILPDGIHGAYGVLW